MSPAATWRPSKLRTWQYRLLRPLGRLVTRSAAILTLGQMPPFVSTSALVVEDDRILVVIDPIRREPILPGGHLRWRETPEAALIREVREETGLSVLPQKLVAVVSREELTGEPGVVRVIYTARVTGGTLTSSGEGEARWMALEEAVAAARRDGEIIQGWRDRLAGVTTAP